MFGCRRDALFEVLDAVLTAPTIESPAHLSLEPTCQRGWGSIYDALNAGTMDRERLEALVGAYPLASETAWYAVDASVWPRCDAETSPERGYYAHPYRHSHGQPIVAGWNYSWLVQVPSHCSSWTAPLRVRRIRPGENLNEVAAEQIRSWLGQAPPVAAGAPLPIFSFDAGYDSVQLSLALADEPVCLLVRLRAGRCFYADPTAQPPTGRPRRHGAKFVCADPTSWPEPTAQWSAEDPQYGRVQLQAWSGLHPLPQQHAQRGTRRPRPLVRGTLIRLEVDHLPRPTKVPEPLWFWWWGPGPPDLAVIWQVYIARFSVDKAQRGMKAWNEKLDAEGRRMDIPMKPQVVAQALMELAASDAIITGDSGTNTTWIARNFRMTADQMFSCSGNLATMAPGLPYAIGAQVAYPNRQVIAFVGDGGFTMLMGEVLTAVKYNLPIKVIVIKNDVLAQIKWEQIVFLGNPEYGVELQPAGFAGWARAAGAVGYHVEDPAKVRDVMREFLASPRPAVLECVVDPNEPPMPAKIRPEQAQHFAEALLKGQPQGPRIALTLFRDKIDELIGSR